MKRFLFSIASLGVVFALSGLASAVDQDTAVQAAQHPADNSGKNVRDRDDATLTPGDQARGSDADVKMTQEIRKSIVHDRSLSMNAHNVKIITLSGTVTLRGPVKSQAEKVKIAQIAARHAGGSSKVANQIEVAP